MSTVIIGAGHSGLAMSSSLTERSIDHVLIDRGEVANSWKMERWDSVRLLTPNWQSRLPGHRYNGDDPDGFMAVGDVVDFIETYADRISAPVETRTTVACVQGEGQRYRVDTDRGSWPCRSVVLASGACNLPQVPVVSSAIPLEIDQLTPNSFRNPDQLKSGG